MMSSIDEDIEKVRRLTVRAWEDKSLGVWLIASCVLLGFRIGRALGAK